ncbi:MAG TPA: DUF1127 domain-containing protein [Acetobacteraceae bacterium]|nr:DUF1127 domain-containing protein [Acetobacteraceae bacterium]
MVGLMAKLPTVMGERRRTRKATEELAILNDRMLADIGLRREEVHFAARNGLEGRRVRMDGVAQSRRFVAALAVVTATVAGLSFAAAPARAEGEGNGDPFALHVVGETFGPGRSAQAQTGMDAGPQTFGPLPGGRQVEAAPAQQTAPGPFALHTRP